MRGGVKELTNGQRWVVIGALWLALVVGLRAFDRWPSRPSADLGLETEHAHILRHLHELKQEEPPVCWYIEVGK